MFEDLKIISDVEKLKIPCQEWDFQNPPFNVSEFSHALLKLLYTYSNGMGLAAPQVGVPYKIFVMRGIEEAYSCINPRVAMYSDEQIELDEGCLSYPGLMLNITRPRHGRVRFAGPNGEVSSHTFTGMTFRCFLHELDHCNGKLFVEYVSRMHLQKAIKKAKKLGFNYEGKGLLKLTKEKNHE
jgi:peptide deformylase